MGFIQGLVGQMTGTGAVDAGRSPEETGGHDRGRGPKMFRNKSFFNRHELNVPVAMFAGYLMPHIFGSCTKFAAAVRTGSIKSLHLNGCVVGEGLMTVLALYLQAFVFGMNSEFLSATGTKNVMAFG
jgi:hypothetical protein